MKFPKLSLVNLVLIIIVLSGVFLRFYNLNWDQGHSFHPDERNIAAAVSRIRFFNQLNPKFFAYGSLPIYLYRSIGEGLAIITKDSSWVYQWDLINLIGRHVSAFLASFSVILVFLIAKRIWNEKIGLLASFIAAFSPSLIQTAHFSVTESMLVFWLLLILILSLRLKQSKPKDYLLTGIVLGLAIATKISALSFLIIPLTTHFLYHFRFSKRHLNLLIILLTSFLVFSLFSPYVFLDKQKFLESMNYETGVSTGKTKVCYTTQFENSWPYFFQIKNFFWQIGPAAILGVTGILWLLTIVFRKRSKKILVFLVFPLAYFIYVGSWHTKFIRYMVPILPFLTLTSAWLIHRIYQRWKSFGKITIIITLLVSLFWGLAFFSIYSRKQTRIAASEWIYQNIPRGSKILGEHWDDGLPTHLNQQTPAAFQYEIEQLTIYESDNQQKLNYYAKKLSNADYIIINSRRLYGTLINLPDKYPLTSRYYQLLFSNQLGYQKVAQFTSYPSLFGIEINDDSSEETFQVYDHPKVIIFKNQARFTFPEIINKLK